MSSQNQSFNPQQQEAIAIVEGPVLVIAGAGSGKTSVVTHRIAHLIDEGIPSEQILGVTFTNKAAGEMKERVRQLTNHHVLICTFHSLGVRILRESIEALGYSRNFTIYDEEDANKILKDCLEELNISCKKGEIKVFRSFISNIKNNLIDIDDIDKVAKSHDYASLQVYLRYQERLRSCQAVDFDDLLFLTVKLWKNHPEILAIYQKRWPFVLIDEYQDTNQAQYMLTKLLVQSTQNIFVVGDPDQSIYSWRGANIRNILEFERDYPGARVINLEQNYRSSMSILETANSLIDVNRGRYKKELWSELGSGEKVKLHVGDSEREEALFVSTQIRFHQMMHQIPYNEIAVLYRTNAQSRVLEDYFLSHRIPYVIVGGISFYQRKEIKDILAFLRMTQSEADYVSWERTVNLPKRGIGQTTMDKIRVAAFEHNCPILTLCEKAVNKEESLSLKLTAKQKEALGDYLKVIHHLQEIKEGSSLRELVVAAIESTGYLTYLREDKETFEDRRENVNQLIAKAMEWEETTENPTLEAFLEELSLKSTLDETHADEEKVSLMTLHNSKGLEYQLAFLIGLEEDLFPHVNSRESEEQIEEERRLCYVGITRAKQYLYMSCARTRNLWGSLRAQKPSRFLIEIPPEFLERIRRSY